MSRSSRHRIRREDKQKALIILSVLFFCIAVGGFLISRWENKRYATGGGEGSVEVDPVLKESKKLTYDGKTYVKKKKIRSYLIMGADTTGEKITRKNGGQADAQFLVVIDDEAKTWRILEIDRDTMVDYEMLDDDGVPFGTTRLQITLVHNYGTWEEGARSVVRTVSDLLKGQRIDGYFSMNMEAIHILNDMVGGVPVTITTDFTEVDDSLPLGEEVVLMGDQAETFVRSRRTVDNGTNEARMARQEVYMKGLIKQIKSLSSDEILDIYDQLMNNSVTNMGSGDFVDLADMAKQYTQLDNVKFEGTHEIVGRYMQFTIDEESLQKTILELFYTEEN